MISIIQIFILSLISKESAAFTFQQCYYSTCLEPIYEQKDFNADFLKTLYEQDSSNNDILIDQADDTELIINCDGISGFTIKFINIVNSQVTIETNAIESSFDNALPDIDATDLNVFIKNINSKNDKTVVVSSSLKCKTISSKDPNKPLYFIHNGYEFNYNITSDIAYVKCMDITFNLDCPVENALTLILIPILYYNCNYDCRFEREIDSTVYVRTPTTITYGKMQVKYEFTNQKTLTIKTDEKRIQLSHLIYNISTITTEDGLSKGDIFKPRITSSCKSPIILKGNWPIVGSSEINGEFMENGSFIEEKYVNPRLEGTFEYSGNHFPIEYFQSTIILAEKTSSFYLVRGSYYSNWTIETKAGMNDNFLLNLEGRSIKLENGENSDGSIRLNAIITSSDKLTIIANTDLNVNVIGPAKIIYRKIDNSEQEVRATLPFLQGGTIIAPYSIDYMQTIQSLSEIYENYKNEKPEPVNATASEWANYGINFAKNKINDLATIINKMANQLVSINIEQKQALDNSNPNSKIVIARYDIPLSSLYQNGLNKAANAVCLNSGTIDTSKWNVQIGMNILKGLFGYDSDEDEGDDFISKYLPTFSDTVIPGEIVSNNDGKCIAYKPTSIPGSAFELIIYTSNTTLSQILEKITLFVTLTPNDLDAFSKLKNSKSKNFIVIALDDLPDGKAINLNGIREDSNIFLMGYHSKDLNDIYDMIQQIDDINWSYEVRDEADRLEREIFNKFASKYTTYQPKASITFGTVQSFLVGLINYVGTHIKCKNFYPILSTFSKVADLSKDFQAEVTLTETLTYKGIADLQFYDLVIFPVHVNPINLLVVEQIDFTESQWNLKLAGLSKEEGFLIEKAETYSIKTSKVSGQLIVYSFTSQCIFSVPETKDNQKIKGITVNSHFTNFNINEIPGIMILEDNSNEEHNPKKLIKRVSSTLIKGFLKIIKNPASLLIFNTNKKVMLAEEEEGSETITFTGNWDKVSEITNAIEINTGDQPAVIKDIPAVVANVLEVKSNQNIELSTTTKVMKFTQPQIITQAKTVSFSNKDIDVSFNNLTFKGSSTSLSLVLGDSAQKIVTDHILLTTKTSAVIKGDLEVKESFEFGPASSLSANSITSNKPKLTLNYRLSESFGAIPDSIQPDSIVLNYIGESNNIDDVPDYQSFIGLVNNIKTFTGNNHKNDCDNWKGKTTLNSIYYSEFRGENPVVSVICVNDEKSSSLSVNVTRVPSGEIVIVPGGENQPGGNPNDKGKKFPIGAIIGIAVGGVALIAIISVLIWYFVYKKKKAVKNAGSESP